MAQPRRRGESDIYHIIARGTGKQLIFEDDSDRGAFLSMLGNDLAHFGVKLYAWCLMGNHVHFLMHAPMESISKCMQHLCSVYAQYFNQRTGRVGHLFQERFKSEPVDDDEYLLTVVKYIHLNPDKAGIAPYDSYPWSSFKEYLGTPRICDTSFVSEVFGGDEEYESFHALPECGDCIDVDKVRSATRAMPDELAIAIARDALAPIEMAQVKSLPKLKRNACVLKMRTAGLSVRQIERLTGISRGVIAEIKPDK